MASAVQFDHQLRSRDVAIRICLNNRVPAAFEPCHAVSDEVFIVPAEGEGLVLICVGVCVNGGKIQRVQTVEIQEGVESRRSAVCHLRKYEGVCPGTAIKRVGAAPTLQSVVAGKTGEHVVGRSAG